MYLSLHVKSTLSLNIAVIASSFTAFLPLLRTPDIFVVKNSGHLVEMTRDVCIGNDEMLVSFDVSSLFTNVPVDEAMKVIQKKTATG